MTEMPARTHVGENRALFVYGSLLDEIRRRELLGHSVATIAATLPGYRRGKGRYWYVERRAGAETAGLVLLNLTDDDFRALDRYEDLPRLYTRERVKVMATDGAIIDCWVYLPTTYMVGAG